MKKNLLGLLLFALIGVFSNQAFAHTVTADIQLGDMPYDAFEGYYVFVVENNTQIFSDGSTTAEVPSSEIRVMICQDAISAAGKSVNDLIVTWNGTAISPEELGIRYRFSFNLNTSGTLVIKWAESTPDAIEGIEADSKAIYYADGVVYNQAGEIAIYNVTGKLVLLTNEATVETRDFANGIYIVRSAKGTVKFVK